MKKSLTIFFAVALVVFLVGITSDYAQEQGQGKKLGHAKKGCTTIQSGELFASDGSIITLGFDIWGYNYQAHQYVGYYGNYQRPPQPVDWGYRLMMKWNDAWLSNKDCDGDGLLDRHLGFATYIGSGAWLTNHQSGTYENEDGKVCHWTYFVKIVAVPETAYMMGELWFTEDGEEIGPEIWGPFAIIEEVESDPDAGIHGIQYLSPASPGFGKYKPKK